MSNLTHIMLCEHKNTKPKMIIEATRNIYGHFQGYAIAECCIKCGKRVGYQPTRRVKV